MCLSDSPDSEQQRVFKTMLLAQNFWEGFHLAPCWASTILRWARPWLNSGSAPEHAWRKWQPFYFSRYACPGHPHNSSTERSDQVSTMETPTNHTTAGSNNTTLGPHEETTETHHRTTISHPHHHTSNEPDRTTDDPHHQTTTTRKKPHHRTTGDHVTTEGHHHPTTDEDHHPTEDTDHKPDDHPAPNVDLENCVFVFDDQIVLYKRTLLVCFLLVLILIILAAVVGMYCAIICLNPTKNPKNTKTKAKIFTITKLDTEGDKKQLLP